MYILSVLNETEVDDPMPDALCVPEKFPLAVLPTPLVEARYLSKRLGGPRIFFKRDDLIGFGFGGNKVRGLEYYLAAALGEKADTIVTGAGPQSNHVRATAAAARVAGLHVVGVLHDSRPERIEGNLLLDEILGAEIRFTNEADRSTVDSGILDVAEELRRSGRRPYVVPRGGTSGLGCVGYVLCVREMARQLEELDVHLDWVVLATGACGTHAGLLAGSKIFSAPYRLLGITVSRPVDECVARIQQFAREAAGIVGREIEVSEEDVVVRGGFIGAGYGIPTREGIEAIRLVARTEGVFLDQNYTGKAMAGLMEEISEGRIGKDETVVFLHTGGEPALFAEGALSPPAC